MQTKSNQSRSNQAGDPVQKQRKKQEKKYDGKKWPIALLVFLVTVLFIGGATYRWQEQKITQTEEDQQEQAKLQKKQEQAKGLINAPKTGIQTVSLDNNWNAFYDYDLGVSFKFPKKVGFHGECSSNGMVDMKVIKDGNVLYLATTKTMLFESPRQQGAPVFKECVPTSLETLKKEEELSTKGAEAIFHRSMKWKIAVENIENEEALGSYIRKRYNSSECNLKTLKPFKPAYQPGVYAVSIDNSSCMLDETCCINYGTFNYYHPGQKKLINFDIGQDLTFATTPWGEKCVQGADARIIDSIRFLE